MTFKVIRGQGQGQEMTSVPYWDYFLEHGQTHKVIAATDCTIDRTWLINSSEQYRTLRGWSVSADHDLPSVDWCRDGAC